MGAGSSQLAAAPLTLEDRSADAAGAGVADAYSAGAENPPAVTAAEVNAQHRKKALSWLEASPLCDLVVLRNVLRPLQRLQRRHIFIGSRQWEQRRAAAEARAMQSGSTTSQRIYPLGIAADGCLESEALEGLKQMLNHPALWSLIPESDHNAGRCSMAFATVSRAGALVHKELAFIHCKAPFTLFLAVGHPALAERVKATPSCLLDRFSRDFLGRDDLASEEARQMLLLVCRLVKTNISEIECRHAALRRLLTRVQARHMELDDLAALWVGQRCRQRSQDDDFLRGTPPPAAPEPAAAARPPQANPGPWRAFVALKASNTQGKPDLQAISEAYHARSEQEAAQCARLAGAVAAARAAGDSTVGLGMRRADQERALAQQASRLLEARMPLTSGDPEEGRDLSEALVQRGEGVQDALATARAEPRVLAQRVKEAERRDREATVAFQHSCGTAQQQQLASALPSVASLSLP